VVRECRRVARDGATIALTTNLQGHMHELYAIFDEVLTDDESRQRLREHVEHRATVASVRELLESNGFKISRIVDREESMRFANGTALLNHYFIKLGFLDAWKKVVPGCEREVFSKLRDRIDGEIRLTIPLAYIEARSM
jgi:arsenite methyltransferase